MSTANRDKSTRRTKFSSSAYKWTTDTNYAAAGVSRDSYRLVHEKTISPRRMPLAISSQSVNIWYHTDPHDQCKRVRG